MKQALPGKLAKLMVWYQDISVLNNKNNLIEFLGNLFRPKLNAMVSGHLGTEHMRHLSTRYWTSRY
jgi:hypothetical protein